MTTAKLFLFTSLSLLSAPLCSSVLAQEREQLAIIPTFHNRADESTGDESLQLAGQRFVLFVYRNAVAVYSETDFYNSGSDSLTHELALPSTGHLDNEEEKSGNVSNGILSVQLWVEGERVAPEFTNDGEEDWYTLPLHLESHEQKKVKSLFWAQTSLTDVDSLPGLDTVVIAPGKRGFAIDISHAARWNGTINAIDVTAVLRGGMTFRRDGFAVEPDPYDQNDTTMSWSMTNIEPTLGNNISVLYEPSGSWGSTTNTMAGLSNYLVKRVYDQLLDYVDGMDD